MEAYLQVFVNFKQNNWALFLFIAKFVYNNVKNASISHISFELNYGYHPCVSYEKNLDYYSKLEIAQKLSFKLQNLMAIC